MLFIVDGLSLLLTRIKKNQEKQLLTLNNSKYPKKPNKLNNFIIPNMRQKFMESAKKHNSSKPAIEIDAKYNGISNKIIGKYMV